MAPGKVLDRRARDRSPPPATCLVTVLTAAMSMLALSNPHILTLLERHPRAWQPATFWHLFTPLLVHDHWIPLALNLAGLLIIGTAVERELGAARWSALYLFGGVVGELLGMSWQPIGAGNSVASFGLIGGLLSMLLRKTEPSPSFAALYAFGWVAAYTGLAFGGTVGSIGAAALCAPLGAVLARVRAHDAATRAMGTALAAGMLLGAVLLCVHQDIHGPPVIVGLIIGAASPRAGAPAVEFTDEQHEAPNRDSCRR